MSRSPREQQLFDLIDFIDFSSSRSILKYKNAEVRTADVLEENMMDRLSFC
jgi:hypothetical protein